MMQSSIQMAVKNCIATGCTKWAFVIAEAEKGAIKAALEQCNGNQTDAAKLLDLSRNTFRERLGRYDLRGYGK